MGARYIDFPFDLKSMSRALAATKFEWIFKPLWERMHQDEVSQKRLTEDMAPNDLLSCSILTRCYLDRLSVLFLSLAMQVRLALGFQEVFREAFV